MGRLIVVSNRIPTAHVSAGGLVVAMEDCLAAEGGLWIGSSGETADEASDSLFELPAEDAYRKFAYDLTEEENQSFYLGYANSVLWPLFHHRSDLMDLKEGFLEGYIAVNRRVAGMLAPLIEPGDAIWIHDYHFFPLAAELRKLGIGNRIGLFLHIPFLYPSDAPALPQFEELGDWLLDHDVVGLQTRGDAANCMKFLDLVGAQEDDEFARRGDRKTLVRAFPIGIDAVAYAETARQSRGADRIVMAAGQKLILGVDRLDYSKGIVNRFEAFGAWLAQRDGNAERPTLLQIAPPSRQDVKAYQEIRVQLETMTGAVNGAHSEIDWTPIRYIHRAVDRDDLAGIYRRADVCMVTPLADGMNLVAKEFVAAQDEGDPGVLILSHFAGAADQMPEALMVNPYDIAEMAEAIGTALSMPLEDRKRRHAALLKSVEEEDITWWSSEFLTRLRAD